MQPNQPRFSKKWQQFRHLSRQVNQLLENGQFYILSRSKQQKLLNRLRRLFADLKGVISRFRLEKALAGAAVLLGITISGTTSAQTFAPGVSNPFGINTNNFSIPNMVDIDADGDLDMFVSEYGLAGFSLKFIENEGTANNPDFSGQPVASPFGAQLQNIDAEYIVTLDFADMDDDGDQDLIVGGSSPNYTGTILYYENTGTPEQASFGTPLVNPFGFIPTYYNAIPVLADLDKDGDFDLLVSEYYGNFQYFENTGTPSAPAFANPVENPFGLTPIGPDSNYSFFTVADVDNDGDLDLLNTISSYYTSTAYYQENFGTPAAPDFEVPAENPFNLEGLGYLAIPHAADIDTDGDADLFYASFDSNTYSSEILYFENTGGVSTNDLLNHSTLIFGPNPASDLITLQSEILNGHDAVRLTMVSVNGKILDREVIRAVGNQLSWEKDVRFLPAGTYFIRLDAGEHYGVVPFQKL